MKHGCDITVDTRMVNSGGIGTHTKGVLPHLCKRFDVVQIGEEVVPGVPVRRFDAPLFSISEQLGFVRHLLSIRPRLHLQQHFTIPLLYQGKMVTILHDVFHLANPQYLPGLAAKLYAGFMIRRVVRRSEAVVTVSHFQRDEIIKYTGAGPSVVKVVHNGVSENWRPACREEIIGVLKKYDLPHTYVLYVGNVKPHKNIERIIQAVARVPDIPLVVVGERIRFITKLENIGDIVRNASIEDRVHFTGYVDDSDLPALYSGASVFVFPSLYEGFGLPPLEAMACGTPAIASRNRLSDEIYGDAYIGVDPYSVDDIAEKIRFALNGGEKIEAYRSRGFQRSAEFTWKRSASQISDIIDNVLRCGKE